MRLRSVNLEEEAIRTFRIRVVLRVVVALAGAVWAAALLMLLSVTRVPWTTLVAMLLFIAFFGFWFVWYTTEAITLGPFGITHRRFGRTRYFDYEEIRRVHILPGIPVRIYTVIARSGSMVFSGFIAGHRELFELLVKRARLEGTSPRQ